MLTFAVALLIAAFLPLQTPAAPHAAPVTIATTARTMQPGEVVPVTITTIGTAESIGAHPVKVEQHPFKVDAHTWKTLVGIDLEAKPGSYAMTVDATIAGKVDRTSKSL